MVVGAVTVTSSGCWGDGGLKQLPVAAAAGGGELKQLKGPYV